jgi:hypothetical protein
MKDSSLLTQLVQNPKTQWVENEVFGVKYETNLLLIIEGVNQQPLHCLDRRGDEVGNSCWVTGTPGIHFNL